MAVLGDGAAMLALAAGFGGRAALAVRTDAVEAARQDARGRGLADAAHAGQHEAVRQTPLCDRIGEGAHQRFLADQPGEITRPVFAREDTITFGGPLLHTGGRGSDRLLSVLHLI